MADESKPAPSLRRSYWSSLLFFLLYLVTALACLRQWGSTDPWARFDRFSGGYLLISLVWLYQSAGFHQTVFRSKELMREASGFSYDPKMMTWISIVSVAELAVFLDYAHWRLTPKLELPLLQYGGLALNVAGAVWLVWVDCYLVSHFASGLENRRLITEGPYRFLRHPRYLALLVSRAAFALIFASALAWGFVLAWIGLVVRRIGLEEAHMRELFGAEYETFAQGRARLLPGIY
jgi:protein-S-isoprenylcysteine O-methyltransferase Ste14